MQKINNNNGITLMSLVVIIIIISILTAVSIKLSNFSIDSSKDEAEYATLNIIQQAVEEQYSKAKLVNETNVKISESKPSIFVGTPIEYTDIASTTINWHSKNYTYYEDYYYRLTPSDLAQLKIKNTEDTFIVNYKTGEVYNETKKTTSKNANLYVYLLNNTLPNNEIDKTFSDDE